MENELENIRQDVIAKASYFSNIYAIIDFLIESIGDNDKVKSHKLIHELINDIKSLGIENSSVEQKLYDLIKKNKYKK
tara:strand:- start:359 stop:592 length:234 start_codon:yes stop_codon:yes gene_type:complete